MTAKDVYGMLSANNIRQEYVPRSTSGSNPVWGSK